MTNHYAVKIMLKDKDVPQIVFTNIDTYTVEVEAEFVTFGTYDEAVFDKWITGVKAAGIWYEIG